MPRIVREYFPGITARLQITPAREGLPRKPENRAAILGVVTEHFRDIATGVHMGIEGVFVDVVVPRDISLDALNERRCACWGAIRGHYALDDQPPALRDPVLGEFVCAPPALNG